MSYMGPCALLRPPLFECHVMRTVLVHHGDAHAVVDLQQAAVGRVVTRAPPVAAHGARRLRAEEVDARRHRHPDDGEVRVVAEAAHLVDHRL